jgi:phosphate acetyltransferase
VLAKDLILARRRCAGIMLGARVPIIVTSRADGMRVRVASAAVGALYAHHLAQQNETPQRHHDRAPQAHMP